jgi:hypothetical protein
MPNQNFILENAIKTAKERLGEGNKLRKERSDAGVSKIDPEIGAFLESKLSLYDRPSIGKLIAELSDFCRTNGLKAPSRITVYRFIETMGPPSYEIAELPGHVREALYNLGDSGHIPGDQLAFYCFNYGGPAAVSFASGLPWICLHAAKRMNGYRPGGRGLLEAVVNTRGI